MLKADLTITGIRDRKIRSTFGSELMKARFTAKITVNKNTGCYEWQAARHSNGYGQMRCEGITRYAHRLAWELACGVIPFAQEVLHRCDNRRCVNPSHLFLGTQTDNIADAKKKGRTGGLTLAQKIALKPWKPVPEWRKGW